MSASFETIVVGLGAVGSAAAYHLARRGVRVLGLDRHAPPHALGSSHGDSRIVRRAYFEGRQYLPLLARSWNLWRELESTAGRSLINSCGALNIGPADRAMVTNAKHSAEALDLPHTVFTPQDVQRRFPAFHMPEGSLGVLDIEAGLISPEDGVWTHLELAVRHGATLRIEEPTLDWTADADGVTVTTSKGVYQADQLVLSVGGWIKDLLGSPRLPVTIERVANAWFQPKTNQSTFNPAQCPVFIWEYEDDKILYGFPDLGQGVKAGLHYEGTVVDHPDMIERDTTEDDADRIRSVLEGLLPDAVGTVTSVSTCFYTNTPDKHYLLDHHPEHPHVVYASSCSGHGFKTSPAIGEALADLVTCRDLQVDIEPFRFRW